MKKKFTYLLLLAAAILLPQNIMAAKPDLSEYTLIKTLDFTTNTYPSDQNITISSDNIGITAYETGNAKQQDLHDVTSPELLKGNIYFQGVGSKGWTIRSTKGGLWSYNATRSAAIPNLKKGYVVIFNCTDAASNVMTLTNADGNPDGNFTYEASEDGKSYYCTMTDDGYVGFCGNKSKGYIASIQIYAPGIVVLQPTGKITAVNGTSRTVEFSGTGLAYNTDGSDNYTATNEKTWQTTVNETTTFYVVSTNGTEKSEPLVFTVEAGTELSLANPTVSLSAISAGYAKTYKVTCDNKDVLLNPTAKLTYDFTPAGEGTAEQGVEFDGTIEATTAGTYTITASAEGYKSTTAVIDNTKEYELTKSIDFQTLTAADLSANWKLRTKDGKLPGSDRQWPKYFPDVVTDAYYYDFASATASSTDIIAGLDIEMDNTGKTPELYTGWGLMYPVHVLDADGKELSSPAIEDGAIAIANGKAEQYGVYTYMTGYEGKLATSILAGDKAFSLIRFSNCLTKVEIYTPKYVPAEPVVATFNFNDSTSYAVSTQESTDGDILNDLTLTAGDVSLTVVPSTTEAVNRFWSTNNGPQLRVYDGNLSFNVPEGKAIKAIEIKHGSKWGAENTINGTVITEKWEGNSTNAMFDVKKNSQINRIDVTIADADDATTTYVPEIANLTEMKRVAKGTEVKLTLKDAKITKWNKAYYNSYAYIEDAEGGIKIGEKLMNDMEGADAGKALNGTIMVSLDKDYYGNYKIEKNNNTSVADYTMTDVEIKPTETTLKSALNQYVKGYYKYITLKDFEFKTVKINEYSKEYYLKSGNDSVCFYDEFIVLPEDLSDVEKFNSFSGYLELSFASIGDNAILKFFPCEYDAVVKPATVVENIAAAKKAPANTKMKLTLKDAKVTVHEQGMMGGPVILIEDASGAIQVATNQWESGLIEEKFTAAGQVANGYLYCKSENYGFGNTLAASDSTSKSEITITTGEIVPTEVTIADLNTKAAEMDSRLVKISNATMKAIEYSLHLYQGNDEIEVFNQFNKVECDENGKPTFEKVKEIVGYISVINIDENNNFVYVFTPTAAPVEDKGEVDGISSVNVENVLNGDVYNLNGVKVRKAGESLEGLVKGLYIVNGKKVVVK